ncbi:uncharacterized protein LOC133286840, partial [Gastrolobium bilobum]|uniref:uncharacterized protein LOC133286840 n=1 Tax=Gastrolobium bilobum TaxID=150636 RepID=UPI002AAFAF1B
MLAIKVLDTWVKPRTWEKSLGNSGLIVLIYTGVANAIDLADRFLPRLTSVNWHTLKVLPAALRTQAIQAGLNWFELECVSSDKVCYWLEISSASAILFVVIASCFLVMLYKLMSYWFIEVLVVLFCVGGVEVVVSQNQSPMEVEDVKHYGNRKRKLLVNERVEIRSMEDGLLGSWHQGIVIKCGKQKRRVRYDNFLDEAGSNHLVDVVEVSPVLDGGSSSSFSSADGCNERGLIRPLPPLIELGVWDLPFGLCVDAFYEEARWEGVIFDHCNGMEERSIFFPDLGDELKIGIDQLRITQDWNEATENWEPRGKWMFLEVIEECEQFSYIAVSFKQIWYDLRNSNEFDKIRDWTCNVKDLWRDLVREIVGDYFTLTLEEVCKVLDFSGAFLKETPELESVEHTDIVHCDSSPSNVLGSKIGISDCPMESGDSTNLLDIDQNGGGIVFIQEKYDTNPLVDGASEKEIVLVEEPESQKEISCYDAGEVISDSSYNERSEKRRRSTSIYWQPLVLSEVEFCPDVINQYGAGCESKMTREGLKTKAIKHLAYLGWRIEWTQHKNCPGQRRYRYMSPNTQDKKVYYSIPQVCSHLKKESNMNFVLSQIDQSRMHSTVDNNLSNLDVHHPIGASSPVEVVAESHTPDGLPIGNTNHKRTTKSKACPPKHKRNGLPTRVQNVNSPCLSHQNVLSWLIDSNMVLPRSKVYYRGKGGKNTHDIEGRVTLDGIKCSCCQNVYRPGGFAIHANGCYDCKPCASIFLRDGRSLLDCMIQLMHKNWAREALEKQCNDMCQGENDNFSVCHYGGELILCDKCPSAFHVECLGLEDIPDGDWFCPSCRCRICNEIKIQGTEDGDFLTCIQCEHKYHIGCLRKRAGDKSRIYLKKNWLCGEECEQ